MSTRVDMGTFVLSAYQSGYSHLFLIFAGHIGAFRLHIAIPHSMDRKTLIGFGLITVILTAWMMYSSSVREKEAIATKKRNDSLALIESKNRADADSRAQIIADSLAKFVTRDTIHSSDSLLSLKKLEAWGQFSQAASGDTASIILENEKLKAVVSPKGGRIVSVLLKGYRTYDTLPLYVYQGDSSRFDLSFFDAQRRRISTDSLYFQKTEASSKKVNLRLYADRSTDTYIEYSYTLAANSNLLSCAITFANAGKIVSTDQNEIQLNWAIHTPSQEKDLDNQRNSSTLFYQIDGEDGIEELSLTEDESENSSGELKWVSFKQQYFTSTLIADTKFGRDASLYVRTPSDPKVVKAMGVETSIPILKQPVQRFGMQFYFGPTKYKELKALDLGLEKQVDLGSSVFGWLNKYAIMPVFTWLSGMFSSYGIVILLLTIIVKIVLFPIAYKSFMSSAKMRVLKPEMDEINEKFKDGDPMKKQQEVMSLYRKAGVNPMAGCIPLLLQLPILFALLRFFPTVFELRQAPFWWATDLSTYDSVLDLGFRIPGYGDHVSLFALLMTVSTILYTWMNQQMLNTGTQLPGMKWLIYLMPILFLGFLNSTSAALSYYYFVSNIITFLQMYLMRRFVDEEAIRAKIDENKKKPAKTSGFLQRLEAAQRERMKQIQQPNSGSKKKK